MNKPDKNVNVINMYAWLKDEFFAFLTKATFNGIKKTNNPKPQKISMTFYLKLILKNNKGFDHSITDSSGDV